jgi:hypothetical protein
LGYGLAKELDGADIRFLAGSPERFVKAFAQLLFEYLTTIDTEVAEELRKKLDEGLKLGVLSTVEDFLAERRVRLAVTLLNCINRVPPELWGKVGVRKVRRRDGEEVTVWVTNEFAVAQGYQGLADLAADLGLAAKAKAHKLEGRVFKAIDIPVEVLERVLREESVNNNKDEEESEDVIDVVFAPLEDLEDLPPLEDEDLAEGEELPPPFEG